MDGMTLASEIIRARNGIIKLLVVVIIVSNTLWAAVVGGFIWRDSLPVEETQATEVYSSDNGTANYIGNDMSGVINNGGESDGN